MRPPSECATIQIEVTNFCHLKCNGCTRFCGHHQTPFYMTVDDFKKAIDSLVDYAKQPHAMVGFMGGSPEWHPQFAEFCEYALSKIPRRHLGLWGTFPVRMKHYGPLIAKTFSALLINDHSRDDIKHAPVLMAAEDYFRMPCPDCGGGGNLFEADKVGSHTAPILPCPACKGLGTVTDEREMFAATERCWIQETWSASINPKGAWFCEVAGALSEMFDGPDGWPVEPDWWKRTTMDFREQRDWACRKCGAALPIARDRISQDPTDDISPSNLERLRSINSKKVARGEFVEHQTFKIDPSLLNATYPDQTYKDLAYRQRIARRYGLGLKIDDRGYMEPYILSEEEKTKKSLFKILQEE